MSEWEKQEGGAFWKPEKEGEQVQGEIISMEDSEFGTCYKLKQEDGTHITLPSHKALLGRLANAKVGDEVKVVFVKQDIPKQKGWKGTMLYDVFIKKN